MEKTEELLDLAKTEFPDLRLTLAEQRLFREILQGDRIDFGDEDPDKNNPREAGDWREDRTIRAHCIEWLATDKRAKEHITHRGIRMKAARVDGKINLQYADLGFPLELYACALTESLMLGHARLKTLSLQGSLTKGIDAEGVTIDGNLLLSDGFKAKGEVCLSGANIGGQLDCTNAQFHNPEGDALSAENAEVKSDVFLRDGFKAEGEVCLSGANIGGQLDCTNAQFHNPEGDALSAENAEVKGHVFLRDGFKAEGKVRLLGANIGGQLDCTNAQFHNPEGDALSAENAEVKSDVFLRDGFKAEGRISLVGASVNGSLIWISVKNPNVTVMDLRGARVGSLWDSADSWPESGNLYLHNFCYDEIDDEAPHEAKERIQWLRLQPEGRFYPQPYEQLANVLREKGYERAAKRIHIAKNVDRRKRGNMPLLFRPLHSLLGLLTGYGYRPWRPIFVALVLIGIGWGLFYAGGREGIVMRVRSERFVPSSEQNGDLVQPNFHPLLYSFDVFLPVITFEHTEHWAPNENETGRLICKIPINGLALCGYKWFLNVAGWVLTTLFITTLTGTIRRRL